MHVKNLMNSLWDIRIFMGLVPKESPCINTSTHHHLRPRSRMSGATSSSLPNSFVVLTGNTLPFYLRYMSVRLIKLLKILIFYVWDASWRIELFSNLKNGIFTVLWIPTVWSLAFVLCCNWSDEGDGEIWTVAYVRCSQVRFRTSLMPQCS